MHHSNLTKALVVGAAMYKFSETTLEALKTMGVEGPGEVNLERIQKNSPDWIEQWKTVHYRADDPEYWQTLLKQISTMWWTPLNYTTEDFLKVTVPTLLLIGDRDELNPFEESVEMYQLIPNAELAILPNVTHMTALAEEGLFVKVVLDFLFRICDS